MDGGCWSFGRLYSCVAYSEYRTYIGEFDGGCHFTVCSQCPVYGDASEDINFIFRHCPPALQVWNKLIQPVHLDSFLTMDLTEWLRVNLATYVAFASVMEN
ncbi:hypothetical protein V6N13_094487 [Hibiscus sabdariffa]